MSFLPLRRDRTREKSRGQSLVEFALTLPVLLLLTTVALDFGRVYLGWINLQNMARIGANIAANTPSADWTDSNDATLVAYQNQIRADAVASNCALPRVSGKATAPTPTYTDVNADGIRDLGDTVRVEISCSFGVITPIISNVLGGSVNVTASAVFPVKTGMTPPNGAAIGGTAPSAAFMGNGVLAPSSITGIAPFTVQFRDTSGSNPTSWLWQFPDDGTTSTLQDPIHTFVLPGTYVVTMTANNIWGTSSQTMAVTVVAPSNVNFTSDKSGGTAPVAVTFNDASTPGGSSYSWTFGAGQGTGNGTSASHTYTVPGTYDVSLTVTYPSPLGPQSVTKTSYISVSIPTCQVPHLDGVRRNDAAARWSGAGFNGVVLDGPGAPSGNYTIASQSLTANSWVPCDSTIFVNRP